MGQAQPTNDDCTNAHILCPGTTLNGHNIGATSICTGANGQESDCLQAGLWGTFGPCYDVQNSVWYTFTTDNVGGNVVVNVTMQNCITSTDEMQGIIFSAVIACDASTYNVVSNCIPNDNISFLITANSLPANTQFWVHLDGHSIPLPVTECNYDISITGPVVCPTFNVAVDTLRTNCFGDSSGSAIIHASGGNTPYTFSIDGLIFSADSIFSGLAAGNYNATIADFLQVMEIVSFVIMEPDQIKISYNVVDADCAQNDGSIAVQNTGGVPPYTYNWSMGATTDSVGNLPGGNYALTVIDVNGCQLDTIIRVNVIGEPNAQISSVQNADCGTSNGSATVFAFGGSPPYSYLWSNGQNTATADNLGAGTYVVTVTDDDGCIATDTATVIEQGELLNVVDSVEDESCQAANGYIALSSSGGTGPYTYTWSNGTTDATVIDLTEGTYFVTVTDANFCLTVDTYTIVNMGSEVILNSPFTEVSVIEDQGGTQFVVSSTANIQSISWNPQEGLSCVDCLDPAVNPQNSTLYTVTITDVNGCEAVLDIQVFVVSIENSVFIPNAFSPNGDGLNEFLLVRGAFIESMSLQIFDRWGTEVFATTDQNNGWTGMNKKRQALNSGVYAYLLQVTFTTGSRKTFTGDITLVK